MFTKNRILLGLLIVLIVVVLYYASIQFLQMEGFTDDENIEISQAKFYTSSQNELPISLLNMVKQSDFNNASMKDMSMTLDSSTNYLNDIPSIAFELTAPQTKMPSYSSSLDKTMKILHTNNLPDQANIYIPTPLPNNNNAIPSHQDETYFNRLYVPQYNMNSPDYNDNIIIDYEKGKLNSNLQVNVTSTPTATPTPIVSGNVIVSASNTTASNTYVDTTNVVGSYSDYLSSYSGNVYGVNDETGDIYKGLDTTYTFSGNAITGNAIVGNNLLAYNNYSDSDAQNAITPYMGCLNSGKTEAQCSVFSTAY